MGTEVQYLVNVSVDLSNSNSDVGKLRPGRADTWLSLNRRTLSIEGKSGFREIQGTMDKLHDWFNRDSVKRTMLKHEEIFKEQVCELHRLYRVQKSLMAELRNNEAKVQSHTHSLTRGKPKAQYGYMNPDHKAEFWNSAASSNTSNHQCENWHTVRGTRPKNKGQWLQVGDLSSQEASCCSRDTSRSQRSFDLECPAEESAADENTSAVEETGPFQRPLIDKLCISYPQNWPNCSEQDTNVELTLSTGGSRDVEKKREWGCKKPEFGCSNSSSRENRWLLPSTTGWSESLKKQTTETQRFMVTESGKEEHGDSLDRQNIQHPPCFRRYLYIEHHEL
ncbi:uncharacterized protein LOC116250617 [Nymphaea colorata]|nr:uncharacterized protein LOC116250617 [Nymphaea colorata]XP_031480239.1 uncharacterized protein LOC116250617 [Nymphaea colorata]XP_031480241.1 uncharacterized protein LOC116250617 [Nymphaea colorata]XP_049932885.1 uncharacterized protein LOC116250617 [Nymphaea colorata]XP_049932886.1 uncharacterized protein LOC116250617 [Nymphaea colorata]XP_049932887.1 uncharacterized protein LOC116250617 [Nymphaea colorata]XP_049932888.1 uncharacterized protein LOC116250617 [Nymphaea colorata]